jgi:hypothetical protein
VDDVDTLIQAFGARGKRNQSLWKLGILVDLGRLADPRIVRLLASISLDAAEPVEVRSEALSRLPDAAQRPNDRLLAARAGLSVLAAGTDLRLRLRAAIMLGAYVDVDGVLNALGTLAAMDREPIELRYAAYTSLQGAGPTTVCVAILRSLAEREPFGQSARALLTSWGIT